MIFGDVPVELFACAQEQANSSNSILHFLTCSLPCMQTRYQDGYR